MEKEQTSGMLRQVPIDTAPVCEQEPRFKVYVPLKSGNKAPPPEKSPVRTIVPPIGLALTSVAVLPRPRILVLAESTVSAVKQVSPDKVAVPVALKKPFESGPVC